MMYPSNCILATIVADVTYLLHSWQPNKKTSTHYQDPQHSPLMLVHIVLYCPIGYELNEGMDE